MKNDKAEMINAVMDRLDTTGGAIISEYVQWFVISSVIWCAVGVAMIAWSIKTKMEEPDSDIHWVKIGRVACLAFGVVIIAFSLPDLLSPTAAATHQLLLDIFR